MDAETSEIVTIVVKSPYQNFPDQTICCPIQWSVQQLKEEITQTCPSHPSIREQKLIYWGKLLENKAQLKDTLKIYEEGQLNHTVHLILKNDQAQAKETLRKNVVNPAPASSQPSMSQPTPSSPDPRLFPNMWGPTYYGAAHFPSQASNMAHLQYPAQDGNYNQQISAMQQAYVQYMQQYMHLMMGGALPPGTPPTFLQTAPPPPQPHNAAPNLNNPDNPGDERPRDWLDWFYLSSRALIFLTVICFYSSPFRFLLVLVIGFAIYLYQSGFFRYPGPAVLIGDQPPNPRGAPPVGTEPGPSEAGTSSSATDESTLPTTGEDDTQSTSPVERDNLSGAIPTQREDDARAQSTISTERDEDQPTLLGLTWSIVANFFASLLPEQTGIM